MMMRPFKGEKGKGGGDQRLPIEHRNTLYSRSTAKLLEAVSEGVCYGLADQTNPEKSVYFDNVPLMNEDGTYNFQGVSVEERYGHENQDHMHGFQDTAPFYNVGETVENGNPKEVQFYGNFDALRVTIRIPSLTYLHRETGDLKPSKVRFKIRYYLNGVWRNVVGDFPDFDSDTQTFLITGKNTSPFHWSVRFNIWDFRNTQGTSTENEYRIEVSRISEDYDEDATRTGDLVFHSYATITDGRFQYPGIAYIGMMIDGWLFGDQIMSRTFDYKGLILRVPSNYDPATRTYTGVWDGTFKREWSDNPAWGMYELCTNPVWALGKDIPEMFVDKWTLYEFGRYCDAVDDSGNYVGVPDGEGGVEPRWTLNAHITKRFEAYDIIQLFASVFMGMVYWGSGAVAFGQDAPSDPVALFNKTNVVDGLFNRSGSSYKSRFSIVNVTWQNENKGGRNEVEVVEDNEMISRYGQRVRDVVAFGCTRRGEARRYGRMLLENEKYGGLITFTSGMAGARVRPGDLVRIQDPDHSLLQYYGRVFDVVGSFLLFGDDTITMTFDRTLDFSAGGGVGYTMHVLRKDGTILSHPMPTMPASANIVVLTEADGDLGDVVFNAPMDGAVFVIDTPTIETELIRVVSVRPDGVAKYEIAGVLHDPNKYDRVELGLDIPPPQTSNWPQETTLPAPVELTVSEELYRVGPTVKSKAVIGWRSGPTPDSELPDPRVTKYEVQWKNPFSDTEDWEWVDSGYQTSGLSLDALETQYGTYEFRVRARDQQFRISPWAESGPVLLQALTLPPDDVPSLTGYVTGETMNLEFGRVTNLDLDHYEIRFSPNLTNVVWAEGQVLSSAVPATARSFEVPAAKGTYMIKAVDQQGDYSRNATSFSTNMASIFEYNVVESNLENNPTWDGLKYEVVGIEDLDGGGVGLGTYSLYLDGGTFMAGWGALSDVITLETGADYSSYGLYVFDYKPDLGAVYNSRVSYEMIVDALHKNNVMASWSRLSEVDNLAGVAEGEIQVALQISYTELTPAAADAALGNDPTTGIPIPTGDPTTGWSNWQTLVINNYRARSYRFQLVLASINVEITPVVKDATITIDMPDRTVTNNTVLSTSAGGDTTVLFADHGGDFHGPAEPSIGIGVHNMAYDESVEIVALSVTRQQFKINVRDSLGARVARNFDFIAKGYGTVQ